MNCFVLGLGGQVVTGLTLLCVLCDQTTKSNPVMIQMHLRRQM
jgi:hypothetical protein